MILDVIPISLGIEVYKNVFFKMCGKYTTVPYGRTCKFSTHADNQKAVMIRILQGERLIASANRELACLTLTDLPEMPKGLPEIAVKFVLDEHANLTVTVRELSRGKEVSLSIKTEVYDVSLNDWKVRKLAEESELYKNTDDVYVKANTYINNGLHLLPLSNI